MTENTTPTTPTEPTYGWLEWEQTLIRAVETAGHPEYIEDDEPTRYRAFGVWEPEDDDRITNHLHSVHLSHVTSFTPAAVAETDTLKAAAANASEANAVVETP